ncbi:hypothetical protein D3C81_2083900 [compost metagenome]
MAADRRDVFRLEFLFVEQGMDTLCGQLYPALLGNGGAGDLIGPTAAQSEQFGTQDGGHRNVVRGDQFDRRGQFDQCDIQAIQAGPGHHTDIERHA